MIRMFNITSGKCTMVHCKVPCYISNVPWYIVKYDVTLNCTMVHFKYAMVHFHGTLIYHTLEEITLFDQINYVLFLIEQKNDSCFYEHLN